MEIWKKIDGYDNYSVSSEGRVRNDDTGRILKTSHNKGGYELVVLCKNGVTKTFTVHRLVAQAFLPNTENKECVDHINTIKTDNNIKNLRWCSYKENNNNPLTLEKHTGENNHMFGRTGSDNPNSRAVVGINIKNPSITIEFSSICQAQKEGFNGGNICSCCNGDRISHKGYYWCYKEDYERFLDELLRESLK